MENDSNTPEQGTEVVQPEQTDTIPDYVFFDPDEDTEEPADPEMTDDDGTDDEEVSEDPDETEPEGEESEGEEPEEDDDTSVAETIELPDGTKIDRDEVVKGYLRQSDYTRKATEVADQRKTLEAETTRLSGITEAFIDHLSKMIPPPPDQALAYRDPNAYTRQKAAHDAAVAQVQKIVETGEKVKETSKKLSAEDRQKLVREENAKLAERFPQTADEKGREAFFNAAAEAAQAAGFSMDELSAVTDHRMFALAHYAKIGMEAQEKSKKAKSKAEKAPPATPNKPASNKRQGAARNREAMKKLSRTGSIRDALAVDFD
jgi:hypothetical protein